MGDMKSAWEIAQERASRLGKLSSEEEQRQREEECREIGNAIGQKWLDGTEQKIEVDMYAEEQKDLIKRAVIERLVEAVDLNSLDKLKRIAQGIALLKPGVGSVLEQITQLALEYEKTKKAKIGEAEHKIREILHQMRISGTAVGETNLQAAAEWQEEEVQWTGGFIPRLNSLKSQLLEHVKK